MLTKIINKKNIILLLIIHLFCLFLYIVLRAWFEIISLSHFVILLLALSLSYFLILYFLEKIKERDLINQIDQELPYFLNALANNLEKGISLKSALEIEIKMLEGKELGKQLSFGFEKINQKGYSLEKGFDAIPFKTDNLERAIYQISDTLTSGVSNKSDNLKMLSKTILDKQKADSKKYSTKLNFISLIFIVVSAIVPAIFLMFFLIGSSFLDFTISKITIMFVTIILFPTIDLFLLLYMRSNM